MFRWRSSVQPLAISLRSRLPTPSQPERLSCRSAGHPRASARTLLPVIPPHPVSINFSSFGQPRATARSPGSCAGRHYEEVDVGMNVNLSFSNFATTTAGGRGGQPNMCRLLLELFFSSPPPRAPFFMDAR